MPALNINGQRVNVPDSFSQMSPEEQHQTVDGIAQKLKLQPKEKAVAPAGSSIDSAMETAGRLASDAVEPFTSYPETYKQMRNEGADQVSRGVDQLKSGDVMHGAANVGLGALGFTASPINAAIHNVAGRPIERATGIPAAITDTAVSLALPVPKGMPRGAGTAAKAAEKAPTIEALDAAAKAGFQHPEVASLSVKPKAIQDWSDAFKASLTDAGLDENLAPKTWAILRGADKAAPSSAVVTGNNLQSLRRTFGRAAGTPDPSEKLAASKAIEALDKLIEGGITPEMVLRGDPSLVASVWADARGNYAAARRAERLNEAVGKAELQAAGAGSGANIDNATRQQLKSILNNPKARRGYSGEELKMMHQIVKGSYTGDAARAIGNMLGGGGGIGTLAAGATGASAGAATHGPIGAAVGAMLPVVGFVAKKIANAITDKNVAKLNELVRARSPLATQMVRPMQKWDEAVTQYQTSKTPRNVAKLMLASRNLATNLKDAGIVTSAENLIASLQGPVNDSASDKK